MPRVWFRVQAPGTYIGDILDANGFYLRALGQKV